MNFKWFLLIIPYSAVSGIVMKQNLALWQIVLSCNQNKLAVDWISSLSEHDVFPTQYAPVVMEEVGSERQTCVVITPRLYWSK